MIEITIIKNKQGYIGISTKGHAGFAEYGNDIVCASVSVIVINTINSIEKFSKARFSLDSDEKSGEIDFMILSGFDNNCDVLMNSLVLGLKGISDSYSEEYLKIFIKEV